MKNMKLSVRLFLSFGIILVLLITVVAMEYNSINNLQSRKDRLVNAVAINESTQLTRRWTLDYYVTNFAESATNVGEKYQTTKTLMNEGLGIYKDIEDQNTINSMKSELDLYYNSFVKLKDFVDQNDAYSTDMVNNINGILSKLNEIIIGQEKDFDEFINQNKNINEEDTVNVLNLASQMEDEYTEVLNSNQSVISIQSVMIAELRYLLRQDETFDSEVYAQLDTLKSQCDWLYDNFDSKTDKDAIDEVRNYIDDFVIKYEAYKGLLDSQAAEKVILRNLAFSIIDAAEALADIQEVKMASDMSSAIIISITIGVISIIIGL